jgi:Ca2+-binding RTX toxin-like protein
MRLSHRIVYIVGLAVGSFGWSHAAQADTCSGDLYGYADCDVGDGDVCEVIAVGGSDIIECNVSRGTSAGLGDAQAVYDSGETLCGEKYCAWGDDASGDAFCCAMEPGSNVGLTLKGGADADALSFWGAYGLAEYNLEAHTTSAFAGLILGGAGDDYIVGSENDGDHFAEQLHGETGKDTITANAGDDVIYGDDGNDDISGNEGADTIQGGAQDDTITGGPGNDNIHGNEGIDYIDGEENDDTIFGDGDADVIAGGIGADTIYGNSGNDTVDGDAGADVVYGGPGDDDINGGDDNDTLHGDDDVDKVCGDDGDDLLTGDNGNDFLWGGADTDVAVGGANADQCSAETVLTCEAGLPAGRPCQ